MDPRRPYILLIVAAAITITALRSGAIGLLMVAFLGATLTVGFSTGSLAPVYPGISRHQAPVWFWAIMAFAAVVVAANVIGLLARL